MMISRIVLCAFPDRLTAGVWRFGGLVSCVSYLNDEQGLDAFRGFLLRHKNIPISLIADAVEEDYRVESAPHTFGATRHALLERKLGQLYRNSVYRAAHFIGRDRELRRDDLFLLVALSNAECIQPWILAIEEQQAPLIGVYLLPTVSQFLIERLKLSAPHLLLADGLVTGLRQTYFHNGKLRVSRLAPNITSADARNSAVYLAEIDKTRLYLLSQRLIAPATKLSLLVLADGDGGESICRQIRNELNLECMTLDAEKLAGRIGLDGQAMQQFPELLYMQVMAKGQTPVNLAPAALTRNYQILLLSGWIGIAGALALLAGLVLSALNIYDVMNYKDEFRQARSQTQDYEKRYGEVAKNFPATPIPGKDLKTAVDMSHSIEANTRNPQRLMLVISTALDAAQDIQLQRLRWRQTDDPNAKDDASQLGTSGNSGAETLASHSISGGSRSLQEIGFIDGEIKNFNGDYRAALNSVNHLADLIQKDARVSRVEIVQQPVNVSSYSNLQGSTLDAQAQQMPAAQFKLKVTLKQVDTP